MVVHVIKIAVRFASVGEDEIGREKSMRLMCLILLLREDFKTRFGLKICFFFCQWGQENFRFHLDEMQ